MLIISMESGLGLFLCYYLLTSQYYNFILTEFKALAQFSFTLVNVFQEGLKPFMSHTSLNQGSSFLVYTSDILRGPFTLLKTSYATVEA